MSRPATGQVIERRGARGPSYGLRFRAYGKRHYVTAEAATRREAETELADLLADVRRGLWRPPATEPAVEAATAEPTFHEFATDWLRQQKAAGIAARTAEDYAWALSYHLLPFFKTHRLSEITVREVDRYKLAKVDEGVLSPNSINKTLRRLSQVLELAVEYDYLTANPARGKRRRLKGTTPRTRSVEPEQLMALLRAAREPTPLLGKRGRPLLGVLAGAGLRIGEALALKRRAIDVARGTLTVEESKTAAGVRIVDLTPALRDELAVYLADSPWQSPNDLVFPTSTGKFDSRSNVRRRLVRKAAERANVELEQLGIAPIGAIAPHGLRHTFASLRCAVGDDLAYTTEQIGHTDPRFTMRVYTHATKRRARMAPAERAAYDAAVEWARMGTIEDEALAALPAEGMETSI